MKLRNKKTGEIKDLVTIVHEAFKVHEVQTIKNIEANWEDVGDKNNANTPLIKDEKVRKAVRAWAEAVGVDKVIYEDSGWHYEYFRTEPDEYDHAVDIDFWHKLDADLCSGNTYTITELCGEEEE